MNEKRYTLNDIVPSWKTGGGIFSVLAEKHPVPWKNAITAAPLDIDYHGNRSGNKFVSSVVMEMLEDDGTLAVASMETLVALAWYKYGAYWTKLWTADHAEYNPIENYRMTEKGKDKTEVGTQVDTTNKRVVDGETNTTNKREIDGDDDTTEDTGVYGFDSSSDVPSGKKLTNVKTDDEINDTGKVETDDTIDDTGKVVSAGKTKVKHELTRYGNIGVTTSAQMIEGEHSLWINWDYFREVYKGIDDIFVTAIFADTRKDGLYRIEKQFILPVAGSNILGGVKVDPATTAQTSYVGIDADGKLRYFSGGEYVLPAATEESLGGIKANPATEEDTGNVHIDPDGFLRVPALSIASALALGGVKAAPATETDTVAVTIDENGFLKVPEILVASASRLGGVKAQEAGADDTGYVGIDANGFMRYKPGSGAVPVFFDYIKKLDNTGDTFMAPSLGYLISNATTDIIADVALVRKSGDNILIGGSKSGYQGNFYMNNYNNNFTFGDKVSTPNDGNRHTWRASRDGCFRDDVSVSQTDTLVNGISLVMYKYGAGYGLTTDNGNKLYEIIIKETAIVFDYKPALLNGRAGLFDTVTKTFIDCSAFAYVYND